MATQLKVIQDEKDKGKSATKLQETADELLIRVSHTPWPE